MRLSELRRELLSRTEAVDARIIISLATGLDDIHQITESGKEITEEEKEKAFSLLEKRLSGVPMAYITGEKEFYGHVFKVNHATLIPRPDTETIVERALKIAKTIKNPKILDLCTGSGAIGTSSFRIYRTMHWLSQKRITGIYAEILPMHEKEAFSSHGKANALT